ncbi:MAG: sulfotransferase family protein [Candidatus Promineifilaceae bacterium]
MTISAVTQQDSGGRLPDYIGIGTPKAGTTWWHQLILAHPEVVQNKAGLKELNYFQHLTFRDYEPTVVNGYKAFFQEERDVITGEWSPGYLGQPLCLESIAELCPTSKLLLMLRNPVDRTISHYNQILSVRMKNLGIRGQHRKHLYSVFHAYQQSMLLSLHAESLQKLLTLFPREQILILQYEQCVREPEAQLQATYRFLDISTDFLPTELTRSVNKRSYIVEKPNQHERERLMAYFRTDVESMFRLLPELDRSLWVDFN